MSTSNIFEKIIIIDFGSQFTQLIARKVRELGVYSEIINFNQIRSLKKKKLIKGIILSGGPLTTTNKNSISLDNYILGLNLLHDSSASIIKNGVLVSACEQARFNKKKHTNEFPLEVFFSFTFIITPDKFASISF